MVGLEQMVSSAGVPDVPARANQCLQLRLLCGELGADGIALFLKLGQFLTERPVLGVEQFGLY